MEQFEKNIYLIISSSTTSSIDFNEVLEDTSSTLNPSTDGTKCVISYPSGSRPSIYTPGDYEYSYGEILGITTGGNW